MLPSFTRISYMIGCSNFVPCRLPTPLQHELLVLNVYIWTNTTKKKRKEKGYFYWNDVGKV